MISIIPADLPIHFHDSLFFKSLDDPSDHMLLDAKFLKLDYVVATKEDMLHLLQTFRFWGISEDKMHHVLATFYIETPKSVIKSINKEYKEFPILTKFLDIHNAQRDKRMFLAAKYGLAAVMLYLSSRDVSYTGDICDAAALSGSVECLMLARELGFNWTKHSENAVLQGGDALCLDFLINHYEHTNRKACMDFAVHNGKDALIDVLLTYNVPWPVNSTYYLAKFGKLKYLKYVIADGHNWDRRACAFLVEFGCIECVTFAIDSGAPLGAAGTAAAKSGRLDLLIMVLAAGAEVDLVARTAAAFGHLECLTYVIEKFGGPIGDAVLAAASHGKLACLRYLKEKHYTVHTVDELRAAVCGGSLACLELLLLPTSIPAHGPELCEVACRCDKEEVFVYLLSQGSTCDEKVARSAVELGRAKCVKALIDSGFRFTTKHCVFAAARGHLNCLQVLVEANCRMSEAVCQEAAKNGHVECLRFLVANNCPMTRACRDCWENMLA